MCCDPARRAERLRLKAEYRAMRAEYRDAKRQLKAERRSEKLGIKQGQTQTQDRLAPYVEQRRGSSGGFSTMLAFPAAASSPGAAAPLAPQPAYTVPRVREHQREPSGAPPSYEKAVSGTSERDAKPKPKAGDTYSRSDVDSHRAPMVTGSSRSTFGTAGNVTEYQPQMQPQKQEQALERQPPNISKTIIGLVRDLAMYHLGGGNHNNNNNNNDYNNNSGSSDQMARNGLRQVAEERRAQLISAGRKV